MRTFELTESSRFWAIERTGLSIALRYGKIGGKATKRITKYANVAECLRSYQGQIRTKVNDGYVETTTDNAPFLDPTGLALEAALVENPDDLAAHMAFADFLSEQHDERHQERGEFIRLQLQLEDAGLPAGQRKKLAKREKELLEANQCHWLGWQLYDVLFDGGGNPDLGAAWTATAGYRRGWIDALKIPIIDASVARALGRAPALRLLRELILDNGDYGSDALKEFASFEYLGNLRKLRIDDIAHSEYLDVFIARLPHLEELYLQALEQNLGGLFALSSLSNLRILHVSEARDFDIKALARNKSLGRLTHLFLFPDLTMSDDGPHISSADFRFLVASKHFGSLTHLTVRRTNAGDGGIDALLRAGWLARLVELDLSFGCITDAGARQLAASPDYRHLKSLSLEENRLTSAGVKALKRKGLRLHVEDQQTPDPDGEYNDSYLYEDVDSDFDDEFDLDDWE